MGGKASAGNILEKIQQRKALGYKAISLPVLHPPKGDFFENWEVKLGGKKGVEGIC